jgi:hypothetical protein
MSKVYADAITTTEASQDLILGGSGDNVIVTAGATLKTNTVKDSGGNTLWTSDGSGTLSSLNSAFASTNMVLLSTQTASNAASVSFTSGIDSTYKRYIFKFYDVNPVSDGAEFQWQVNAVGGSGFNETITSTYFLVRHTENDSSTLLGYDPGNDQDQGTAYQYIAQGVGSTADESAAGELFLFNPSSTTYVKQFYSTSVMTQSGTQAANDFAGGYINTTAAIDEISFKFSTGNLDAVIKMYGVG